MNKNAKNDCKTLNQNNDGKMSLPNLNRPKNVFKDLEEESSLSLNDRLMKYKEFKLIYKKTNIKPVYFFYSLIVCLVLIFVGFLESYLTLLISTLYPLYISIKSIQGGTKEDIKQWLTYWVVFSLFNNLESLFGLLLQSIPMYFFFKIIFLLVLFLPQYNGASYIYEKLLKDLFNKYESHIYDTFVNITKNINFPNPEDLKKNLQDKVVSNLVENIKK